MQHRSVAALATALGLIASDLSLPARPQEPPSSPSGGVVSPILLREQRGFYRVGEPTENGLTPGHQWYEATRRAELSSVRVSRYAGEAAPGVDNFQMGSGILIHPEGLGYAVGPREVVFLTAGHWAAQLTPATPGSCEFWFQGRWRSVPARVIACHNDSNVFDLAICVAEVTDPQVHSELLARAARLVNPGELHPEQDVVIKSWPDGRSRLQYGKVLKTTSIPAKQGETEVKIPVVQL